MASFNDGDGVWRTIQGRRVFIREGQSLGDAMKASGKFKNLKSKSGKVQSKKELFKDRLKDITAKKDNSEGKNYRKIEKQLLDDYTKVDTDDLKEYRDTFKEQGKEKFAERLQKEIDKRESASKEENSFDKMSNYEIYEKADALSRETKDYQLRSEINKRLDRIDRANKRGEGYANKPTNELREMLKNNNSSNLSQGQKESLGSKYRSSLTKLNDKSIEDGTYDLDTGKKVDFGNKGYNVSFEQSSDNYSDSEYYDKIEECRKLCDGKVYGGKFGGSPEISFYTEDKETAMKIMEKYNQHSIYDNSIGDVIENAKYNAETNKVNYKEPIKSKNNVIPKDFKKGYGKFKVETTGSKNLDDRYEITKDEYGDYHAKNLRTGETYATFASHLRNGDVFEFEKETPKSTNETMNEAIRAKAGKTSKAFKEDLPKKVEIKKQGTSNRKEVSENIQAHILEYYDSPEDFVRQMDVFDYMPTKWHAGQEIAKGGGYMIYYDEQRDFLDSLKINPKGKNFSDDRVFQTYTSLIGRESAKLYDRIKKNAYNKYMKEHPASKMSFEEFKNMRKGD